MIYDTLLKARAAKGKPVRVGLFGAGFMAKGITNQIVNSVPGMDLSVICNRNIDRARQIFELAGVTNVAVVETDAALAKAIAQSRAAITQDPLLLCRSPDLECLVDATGAIEYGAMITLAAIEYRKHMISMNAELDGTVGPLLKKKADAAGIIFSGADGDQPGVQMNLFRFVRSIGLTPQVCGNIKGLQDPYRNPTTQEAFAKQWGQDPHMVTSFADGTKISFEQAIVANATGMTVNKRGMIGRDHRGHVDDLTQFYDLEMLKETGGIVDYVVGAQPGPGIYVLATQDDPKQQHYLSLYKLGTGPLYSFYTPYHLCHFEIPISVARVVLCGDPVLQPIEGPRVDVVATAKKDLKAGEEIDAIGGYMTYGQCETYAISRQEMLLPIGLAQGCRLKRDIPKDIVLTYRDVEIPKGRRIDALRAEQDALFPAM